MRWLVCGLFIHLLATAAAAQPVGTPTTPAEQTSSLLQALDEMRARLDEQLRLITEQSQQIEAQTRMIDLLRQRLDDTVASALRGGPASASVSPPQPQASAEEQASKRHPDLPEKIVTAGEFPGSIAIPGTNAALT